MTPLDNSMRELKLCLGLEQPRINAVIARSVSELPSGTRHVAAHVLSAGGKRLRPFLTLLTGRALGAPEHDLYVLGAAVELLHAATLLHDDILDNARTRRGKPAAHTLYGSSRVILAGDALLAKALLMVSQFDDTRLTRCISEAVLRTAEGEIMEFAQLRDTAVSPDDYLEMITGKTAWLLRASCELGALRSGAGPSLIRAAANFGLELGIAFQMVDDALDFSPESETGKPRGGDVREGKVTPPLSSYLADLSADELPRLREGFEGNSLTASELDALCDAIHQGGHAQRTRERADAHLAMAEQSLLLFPVSDERAVLKQMLTYIRTRNH